MMSALRTLRKTASKAVVSMRSLVLCGDGVGT